MSLWPDHEAAFVAASVQRERERVLAIVRDAPRAALNDGRDLVVRTDIIRKVQHG